VAASNPAARGWPQLCHSWMGSAARRAESRGEPECPNGAGCAYLHPPARTLASWENSFGAIRGPFVPTAGPHKRRAHGALEPGVRGAAGPGAPGGGGGAGPGPAPGGGAGAQA
jgi:hypothetical protein